jgi:hypothetical protein
MIKTDRVERAFRRINIAIFFYVIFIIISLSSAELFPFSLHEFGYRYFPLISTPVHFLVTHGDEQRATRVSATYLASILGFVLLILFLLKNLFELSRNIEATKLLERNENERSIIWIVAIIAWLCTLTATIFSFVYMFLYDGNYPVGRVFPPANRVYDRDIYFFLPAIIGILSCYVLFGVGLTVIRLIYIIVFKIRN